jgi:hypothetical protein
MTAIFSLSGCTDQTTGSLTVDSPRTHAPLLLSEIHPRTESSRKVDGGFLFTNSTDREAVLRFEGAGCSCYSVSVARGPLKQGDEIQLPAGGSAEVHIGVPTITAAGEREYNARFSHVISPEETRPMTISKFRCC